MAISNLCKVFFFKKQNLAAVENLVPETPDILLLCDVHYTVNTTSLFSLETIVFGVNLSFEEEQSIFVLW